MKRKDTDMMHANKLSILALTGFAALSLAGSANAVTLTGSLPLAGIAVSQDAADLSLSSTITDAFTITTGAGQGDYSPIPLGTVFTTTPMSLAAPTNFSISNPVYGSFVATSYTLVTSTAANYDVELFGSYIPGPGLPGFSPTDGELRISINQSGASLSEAITLSTPAANSSVPEPGSVALLLAGGFTGAGLFTRRRRK